jgi:hypothetical protein
VCTIADEQVAVDGNAGFAKGLYFTHQRHGIEHHAVANHCTAARTKYPAGNKLQDELTPANQDGMASVVSAGITRYDFEALRKNIDDLAFAFVSPLRAYDYRCLASLHSRSRLMPRTRLACGRNSRTQVVPKK